MPTARLESGRTLLTVNHQSCPLQKAALDLRSRDGESPLQKAVLLRRTQTVYTLVDSGADQAVLLQDGADAAYLGDVHSTRNTALLVQRQKVMALLLVETADKALLASAQSGDCMALRAAVRDCSSLDLTGNGGSLEFPAAGGDRPFVMCACGGDALCPAHQRFTQQHKDDQGRPHGRHAARHQHLILPSAVLLAQHPWCSGDAYRLLQVQRAF